MGKDLRERLFSIFHHDKEKWLTSELATTGVEKANQVRMEEGGSRPPVRELCLCQCWISRDDLNRGIRQVLCLIFGKEYPAVV